MLAYILRRLAGMLLVMLIVAAVVFVIARVVPGDPAAVMLGAAATPEDIAALRGRLGLDQPLLVQFVVYLRQILTLDLGDSIFLNRPVAQALAERAELTATLTLMAAAIAVLIGVPVGLLSAVKRGSGLDQTVVALAMLAASVPSFWVGLTLIKYLAVDLRWFPVAGYGPPEASFGERLHYLVLPAIALGIPNSALIMRFTRTSMLDVLGEDYVRTARAKGLPPKVVVLKHAFRNALIPVSTLFSLNFGAVLSGAIITETVFGWAGMGTLLVNSVRQFDPPMLMGWLAVTATLIVLFNLIADVVYGILDPRIRLG
jgi:peptide/nickel transport system permease protein